MPLSCQQRVPPVDVALASHRRGSRRCGWSRIELVIVLFMLAVVVGLFMMVVPRFREQANRVQCENNLRQIGVAIHVFRDRAVPPSLPAARIADRHATWAVQIAPFLHGRQAEALRGWDLSRPYADQPDDAREAQLRVFYCPSRRLPGRNSISGDLADNQLGSGKNHSGALSDYACAAGDGDPRFPWTGPRANGTIVLGEVVEWGADDTVKRWRGRTDFALQKEGDESTTVRVGKAKGKAGALQQRLARGTSQTILLGEKHVRPDDFGKAERGDGSAYNGGRPASFSRVGGKNHPLAKSIYDSIDLDYPIFGSYHPEICQFLMADASVRPLNVGVSEELLGRMVVRDEE